LNRVDYFVANDKEKCDVMKKVTKSLKQQEKEKIKTKIDTIYGYEDEKYQKMGSRKKNRWINGIHNISFFLYSKILRLNT